MLENSFERLFLLFRANYYKQMVQAIGTREGSLSATESFCTEVIYLLEKPTITEFANFLGISVPNANYKVNSLVEKGYLEKQPSAADKRETLLCVTDKFLNYYGLRSFYNAKLMRRVRERFTPHEIEELETTINTISELLEGEETVG